MNVRGKKLLKIAAVMILLTGGILNALDVAESEIVSEGVHQVEFENYQGPHEIINTIDEITGIGRSLTGPSREYGMKYRIIRAVDPDVPEGHDSDILVIEESARVDHIKNVQRILSGYLQESYGYEPADAMVLAEFISYYNAVYRGNMEYIRSKYKPVVVQALDPAKAGIARTYREWPGNTMMLIPLTERAGEGGLGSLDTDELSEQEVIEELREQEDRGVEERKEMVELREREIEEERRALEEERQRLEEERQEAADTAAEQEREDAEQDEAELEETERDEAEEEIAQREQELQEREESVRQERERIAEDEQELIEEREGEDEPRPEVRSEEGIIFPRVRREQGEVVSRLVSVDTETGNIIRESQADTVIGREYHDYGENFLVLAGPLSGNGTVTLLLMNGEDLSTVAESDRVVYVNSYVETAGRDIFAVIQESGGWYIGKYDGNLQLLSKSDKPVTMDTVIVTQGSMIYAQSSDGTIMSFTAADLTSSR